MTFGELLLALAPGLVAPFIGKWLAKRSYLTAFFIGASLLPLGVIFGDMVNYLSGSGPFFNGKLLRIYFAPIGAWVLSIPIGLALVFVSAINKPHTNKTESQSGIPPASILDAAPSTDSTLPSSDKRTERPPAPDPAERWKDEVPPSSLVVQPPAPETTQDEVRLEYNDAGRPVLNIHSAKPSTPENLGCCFSPSLDPLSAKPIEAWQCFQGDDGGSGKPEQMGQSHMQSNTAMIGLVDIAPAFSFIVSRGLVPSMAAYDPQAFGNANLVMDGTPFSLRFERDRGQVFVDIGNDAAGWYKLEYVLEFANNSITQKQLGEPPDITRLASLLQGHWDKITHLFNDQQMRLQLQMFAKQKTTSLLGKIFGNP